MENWQRLALFLFEGAMLKRLERTGYAYLGTGKENIAAHSYGTTLCALLLTYLKPQVKTLKVLKMALLHDFLEARTGDLNYVNKFYDEINEEKAALEAFSSLPMEKEWLDLWKEYKKACSPEALLVHDADQLDLILMLKEQKDLGNHYASLWIKHALKRLKTPEGKKLAQVICQTDWAAWWVKQFVSSEENDPA